MKALPDCSSVLMRVFDRCLKSGVPIVLVAALTGCGGDGLQRVPITGVVTQQGSPLAFASIQFFPVDGTPGEGALGNSDEQGKFEVISSRREDTGIPPGKYKVRVSKLVNPDGTPLPRDAAEADYPDARESIPAPFSGPGSPISVEISDSGGEIQVEVPAVKKKSRKN